VEVLREADEVFLTSSTRDVQAVHAVRWGDEDVLLPLPGPLTTQIEAAFLSRAAADLDP
jgi:branched-chain amino acid aminotransferase